MVFRGACREIGRSCVEIQENGYRVLLDAGIKVHDHAEPVEVPEGIDAIILSHAHLDHSGVLPVLSRREAAPVFCTFPTIPLAMLLLEDSEKVAMKRKQAPVFSKSDVRALGKNIVPVPYEKKHFLASGVSFELLDAGHIAGSSIISLEAGGKSIVYTGDYKLSPTRMHSGAVLPEKADALVLESTYAEKGMPERKKLEKEFCAAVRDAVESGFTALVPCFAVGRTQEVLQVLHAGGISGAWVDGMGKEVCSILSQYPSYLRNAKAFAHALEATNFVETKKQRKRLLEGPGVVIATAGMLDGGPALNYLLELNRKGNGRVFFTGFQVEGTNGRRLLEEGVVNAGGRKIKINLAAELFNFSAHASREDLWKTIETLSPEKVFCVHGDAPACIAFAEELKENGFDAHAPKAGEEFEV